MKRIAFGSGLTLLFLITGPLVSGSTDQTQAAKSPEHAKQYSRFLIRNAMVIYGNAEPPFGPADIAVENGILI